MPFIDDLALELITLIMGTGIAAYLTGTAYLEYKNNGSRNVQTVLRNGATPLGIIGLVSIILGLWGEMTWPFPGGEAKFNILFGDPYLMYGVILTSMAVALLLKQRLQYVGFFAFLGGIMSIYYGALLYSQGLTKSPLASLAMYASFGIVGIFTWPSTYAFDEMNEGHNKPPMFAGISLIIFWIFLILTAISVAIIGVPAVQEHLLSTP